MKVLNPNRLNKKIANDYLRKIDIIRKQLNSAVEQHLMPELNIIFEKETIKDGALPYLSVPTKINAMLKIQRLTKDIESHFQGPKVETYIRETASTTIASLSEKNSNRLSRTFLRATGIDIQPIIKSEGLDDFISEKISEHVSLIKNASGDYLRHIENTIQQSFVEGKSFKTVEERLFGGSKSVDSKLRSRIKLITGDQLQTINAEFNKARTEHLGIKEGIWRTAIDKRVRTIHDILNGKQFDLSVGAWLEIEQRFLFPGITDIYCRCDFAPVIPDDFLR